MAELPLRANQKSYLGKDRHRRSQVQFHNQRAQKIVDYINTLIANNLSSNQQYIWMSIAYDFGCDTREVREAVAYGGNNGITISVTEDDRQRMAYYKKEADQE
jgi:hypothetical protein